MTLPASRGGGFGSMFELEPCMPCDAALEALHALIHKFAFGPLQDNHENPNVPAGYTYLGQFIDHDITFDPTSRLGHPNDPAKLPNFRTPRFDLDSLYGTGPVDQPFLYDWQGEYPGVKLLVGRNPGGPDFADVDLPRNEHGRALIGDARNDEHVIISQLHLLFIQFHNKVVETVVREAPAQMTCTEVFAEARRIVLWHYQWIVTHDFLRKLVGKVMAVTVLTPGVDGGSATVDRRYFRWTDRPFIPVEFSAAAFRCGHSMVRSDYTLNALHDHRLPILPDSSRPGQHLGGMRRLPADLQIEWQRFFKLGHSHPQLSRPINADISRPLFHLPDGRSLPDLNLRRGASLKLPSGERVAARMGADALSDAELRLTPEVAAALNGATPLWYYLLCEAATKSGGGAWLGPVGGRIVAEVLVGLLEGDRSSYLSQNPSWTPHLGTACDFTMSDLILFTHPVG